jgi:hypothetical protein
MRIRHARLLKGLEIQRRQYSIATVFTVRDETGGSIEVDLNEDSYAPDDDYPARKGTHRASASGLFHDEVVNREPASRGSPRGPMPGEVGGNVRPGGIEF